MDLINQRRFLNALAVGFLAVAAGGVAWSLGSLDPQKNEQAATSNRSPGRAAIGAGAGTSTEADHAGDRRVDLSLSLLDPLYEPPKPPPEPKTKPAPVRKPTPPVARAPRLNWTLTGTIIDPDRRVAILTDDTGKTDIRSVGEEVELTPAGVLIRKIDADNVTVEIAGKKSTLRLEKSFRTGGVGKPGRPNRGRNR